MFSDKSKGLVLGNNFPIIGHWKEFDNGEHVIVRTMVDIGIFNAWVAW